MHTLRESWILWAHLPHEKDWSLSSYIYIMKVSSAEELVALMNILPETLLTSCMFFLMKEHITPLWEDVANKQGGYFSYKITQSLSECWRNVSYSLVGNTLSKDKKFQENITGISISPKKNFSILKVWMASCNYQDATAITLLKPQGCMFKKH